MGQPFAWSKGPPSDLEALFGQSWASDFLPSKGGNEGLALNPKRWIIGWLASYLERGGKERYKPQVKGPKYREACKHHPMICRHLHTLQVCGGAIHALDLLLLRGRDALNPKP